MRKTLLLSLFLCLGYILNAQTNLIQNPGFEDASVTYKTQNANLKTGENSNSWVHLLKDVTNNIGNLSIVSDDKYEGANSLKLQLENIKARFNFYIAYELTDVKPAKYTYSFYAKTNLTDSINFRVEAYAVGQTNVEINSSPLYLIGGTVKGATETAKNQWKKYTFTIDASSYSEAELKHVNLVIRPNCLANDNIVNKPTTYWLDNFEFVAENSVVEPEVSQYPRFAAISDIHIGRSGWETKVTKTLNILKNQTQKLDAIFIVGDITENGKESEFQQVKETISNIVPADISVYYNLGNHDWWQNKHGETRTGAELFTSIIGQDVNQYIEIKGYPFILISMENQSQATAYQAATRTFLTEKLQKAAADYPGKPIFVFQHVPNSGTVYGSYEIGGGDAWGTATVEDILSKYPQVITFSGHSHYFLADERSIHQDKYTSVNDGSIAYAEIENGLEGGSRPTDSEKIQEGVIVSLDDKNDVTVKRIDFYNNREIKQPWVVKAPHDGSAFAYKNRTGGEKPTFESGAKVTLGLVTDVSVQVTFPIAKDDDDVQQYRVEVLDVNKNVLEKPKFKILSKFYLYGNTETSFKLDIADLKQDTEYYIQVTALDAFGQESAPALLSDKFRTDAYIPQEVEAPKANLIDVKFATDTTLNVVEGTSLIVEKGPTAPTVKYDADIKQYVSSFAGSSAGNTTYYKIDYKNNDDFKTKVAAGFTFEVYSRTKGKGAISSVSSLQSGGIGLEQVKDGGATQLWMGKNPSGNEIIGLKSTYSATDYYHIVAIFDGTNVNVYYNGEPGGSATLPNGMRFSATAAAQWFAIGGDASAKEEVQGVFEGEVALFRMYDRAISRDEINALYKQLNSRKDIKVFDDLNNMIENILPAYIAGLAEGTASSAEATLAEGKALMASYVTTEKQVEDYMARANTLTGAPTIVYGENLILNPNFELSTNIPEKITVNPAVGEFPDKWNLTVAGDVSDGEVEVISGNAQDLEKSMQLSAKAIDYRYRFYLSYDMINVTPGVYKYSFYAKADKANVPFRVEVIAYDGDKTERNLVGTTVPVDGVYPPISSSNLGVAEVTSAEYRKYTYTIDASKLTADQLQQVRLYIRPNCQQGGGLNKTDLPINYYFDNFEFSEEMEKKDIETIVLGEKLVAGLQLTEGDPDYSIVAPMHFTLEPKGAVKEEVVYTVADTNIIEIVDGVIKVKAIGSTTVVLSSSKDANIKSEPFTVTVKRSGDEPNLLGITLDSKLTKGLNFILGDPDYSLVEPMLFTLNPADYPMSDITYSSSNEDVAVVKDGVIQLGTVVGTTEITISSNLKPSIKATFNVTLAKSKDVSFASVTVNGNDWSDLSKVYALECGESKYLTINVETNHPDATVDLGNSFGVQLRDLAFATPNEVRFVITAADGVTTKAYNLQVINNNYAFEDVVHQKFNSRLIVNNNKTTNGGYTFKKYYWIVDGVETEGTQIYSTGNDKLSTTATYAARLITTNNEEMNVCPAQITLTAATSIEVYPNPVVASNTINIQVNNATPDVNLNNSKVEIYSLSGNLVTSTKLAGDVTSINAPSQSGMYVVKVVCDELVREFKINVK